jgi:Flp pilus assembly protein TadG
MTPQLPHQNPPADARDRGSSTLETAILAPALLLLLAVLLQAAYWYMALSAAHAAASDALQAARSVGGTPNDAHHAALDLAASAGKGQLLNPSVHAAFTASQITVTVHGHAPSFFPLFDPTVTATVRGPREHFTIPGGTP